MCNGSFYRLYDVDGILRSVRCSFCVTQEKAIVYASAAWFDVGLKGVLLGSRAAKVDRSKPYVGFETWIVNTDHAHGLIVRSAVEGGGLDKLTAFIPWQHIHGIAWHPDMGKIESTFGLAEPA